jgi:hypothetical protein
LEDRVFSARDFQSWGKDNAILFAAVMTKIEGRENDDLLRTYGFRGFPSMAILDADANAIVKKIPRDLNSMRKIVASTPDYLRMSKMLDAGKPVDAAKWFLAQLNLGKLTAAAANEELAKAKLNRADKAAAEQSIFLLEMTELQGVARRRDATAEEKMAACEAVYEAFKAGKRLAEGAPPEAFVDDMLLDAAKSNNDKEAFAYIKDRVKARHLKRIEDMKGFKERYQADVEKFKDDEKKRERAQNTVERIDQIMDMAQKQIEELEALDQKLNG